jgi:hypothetical protein
MTTAFAAYRSETNIVTLKKKTGPKIAFGPAINQFN